jgi:hypothetical protein
LFERSAVLVDMKYLFDSTGKHIANEVNGQLHALNGRNIGHFLAQPSIVIDLTGRYLGEVVAGNRLMSKTASARQTARFGRRGSFGNAGSYGNPGNAGVVDTHDGFEDISVDRLL